ncbi:MAG TPA: aldehyde dehydrogenase family protein [Bacteroidia bacterium]|nr:aldehyde dehydrogenase family protein [Bacteroidia bacterium]
MNYLIYCGGDFIATPKMLSVANPFTKKEFATTYQASEKELDHAIKKAQEVLTLLKKMPSYKKQEILFFIANEIKKDRNHLAEILSLESAKPIKYALGEIDRAAQTFFIAAEECKRLPKEYISLDWTPAGEKKEGRVKYFPIGVVAGIAPFNFPLNLAVHKIAPAIAAGCPIILKPASATPLSTLELAKIIDRSDLPKGSVSILPMDRNSGNAIVTDERFSLLSFTGSPVVGWEMKKQAGKKKVVLELGGNAGLIITSLDHIDTVIEKCLVGGFSYSGQICIHAQRFFVQQDIFNAFLEKFTERVKNLKYGDPLDAETDVSVMIDEDNAIRVETWINEAVAEGAKIICGGKRTGSYVEPTVLTNTTTKMKINAEEAFGPVVCIEKYNTIEEAVYLINDTKFGLQCGVFTNLLSEVDYCFENIETGGVIINDVPTFRVDHMPYGGIKDSGLGREGVKYAMLDMLEPKLLVM